MRLSQLSALSLLEMSSSESLGVEHCEPLSTSSNLRFRPRDDTVSMETLRLEALQIGTRFVQQTDKLLLAKSKHEQSGQECTWQVGYVSVQEQLFT